MSSFSEWVGVRLTAGALSALARDATRVKAGCFASTRLAGVRLEDRFAGILVAGTMDPSRTGRS